MLCWIPKVSWPLIFLTFFAYLQTNRWLDWPKIWWLNWLWDSLGLVHAPLKYHHFLPSDFFQLFSCICRQTTSWINFKFSGWIHYGCLYSLWNSPDQINFWSHSTGFRPFPGLWFSHSFRTFADKVLTGLSWNLMGYCVLGLLWPDGPKQIFDNALLNPSSDLPPLWFNTLLPNMKKNGLRITLIYHLILQCFQFT